MNLIVALLVSAKRLSKALRFCRSILLISTINNIHMHIVPVTDVDNLLLLILVYSSDQNICFLIKKLQKHRMTDDFQKCLSGKATVLKTTYLFLKSSCDLHLTLWSVCLEVKFSFTRKLLKFILLHQAVSM